MNEIGTARTSATKHQYELVPAERVGERLDNGWRLHGDPIPVPIKGTLGQQGLGFLQAMVGLTEDEHSE